MLESKPTLLESIKGPTWRRLLREALAELGSKQRVADRLGVSRPYVSRVMSGDIDPPPQTFIDRVTYRLEVVQCPHTFQQQPRGDCRGALAPAPTHNPFRLALWQRCQTCEHKPAHPEKES
ncbi:helix-turn-helix transcriptional regulator [Zoogloea sp. 1C4]|uniref:helix-turn-helix domain-containing protein n=1 Tax=Zoogloea sp. 1C4 TaxID=2570190 RepID=UPI0012916910|nr:helix-turn-helix transcriptional regulator [Zoogloea sp. 1C4]